MPLPAKFCYIITVICIKKLPYEAFEHTDYEVLKGMLIIKEEYGRGKVAGVWVFSGKNIILENI